MDRSKLPKPSGLRPPQIRIKPQTSSTENDIPASLTASKFMYNRLNRRSKSFSDLSTTGLKNKIKPFKPLVAINENKPPVNKLRRRSKSVTDITNNGVKKPTVTSKVNGNAKMSVKRPATGKPTGESNPKVSKQSKLPDWDYKGRFIQLKEQHALVQQSNKNMREQLSGLPDIERNYEMVQQDLEKLHSEKINLKKCKTSLTAEVTTLRKANEEISTELADIKEKYKNTSEAYDHLLIKEKDYLVTINRFEAENADLKLTLKNLTEEHKILQNKYDLLTNTHGKLKLEYDTYVVENNHLTDHLHTEKENNDRLTKEVKRLKDSLQDGNALRRDLHNTIQDLKGNIRVFARVRPPINAEEEDRLQCSINYIDENCLEIRKTRESVSVSGKVMDVKVDFKFDKVFAPESTQLQVFEELSQLVQSALDGYNVCVFAYGQTGSGKTFTMQGNTEEPELYGMIPRTIDMMFETIDKLTKCGWTYTVHASFLEIYNENIRDLLDHKSNKSCEIRFNEGKGITVTNLIIQPIQSATELKKYMHISHKNRAVAATDFNEHSSRSHAVTKIYLEGNNTESKAVYSGSINLVDLAGSESAKTSASERIVETKNINKSLSTLGSVMLALYNKENHVPYRNSKLTYLLQSCLGGNSKTLMFVNISPFEDCYLESLNSLRFASKVKEVKLGSKRNKMALSTA